MLNSSEPCPLLQGILYLATTLRLGETDVPSILQGIERVAEAFGGLVSQNACDDVRRKSANTSKSLEEITTVFSRAYPILLRSLQAVFKISDKDQQYAGVPMIVRLFQTFLGQLHQSALDELVRQQSKVKPRRKPTRTKTGERTHVDDENIPTIHNKQCKILVRVLVNMFTTLDMAEQTHTELLEGLMCSLLDHIGSSLAVLVFADSKMSSREDGGICPPEGLLHVAHLNTNDAIDTAKLEAPWLIHVLRKVITYLRENVEAMSQDSLHQFLPTKWNQMKGPRLQDRLKKTLQHTLLRGVFGDDDETFGEALKRKDGEDVSDHVESPGLTTQPQDPADLFVAQLWDILGWGILSSGKPA